ncbi:MAG TPA: 1-deoxy-D-xylulose-5-phosphate synthase N-terminal domain-containing protein [Methylomirabilota bacterium]|nr:1-deoxy-D-xylulose-5-phosphate synthase N-terminal domain-containing protein [Methylomirabilota bacterium]
MTRLEILDRIQRRVLWLSAWMVHHANARPSTDGLKVGGHQASSASVVSLLTALYFDALGPGDVVAVKAHAAPAFYAAQYLRGRLGEADLRGLRVFGGLQAYPSRRKNPAIVDLSTGSMGLGAVAATFGGLASRYLVDHGGRATPERYIVMVGDAELDEGNVWEALGEEVVRQLGNVLWIVDLNRQSLDRIVADTRPRQLAEMFRAGGWRVDELRWGRTLQAHFGRPGGDALRQRLERATNTEYQRWLRLPAGALRKALVTGADGGIDAALDRSLADVADERLPELVSDVGGHDLPLVLDTLATAARERERPTVILAHTIKGWGLPSCGDPLNHTAVTNAAQIEALRDALGIEPGQEWAGFAPDSAEAEHIRSLPPLFTAPALPAPIDVPATIDETYAEQTSTQEAFGRVLAALGRGRLGDAIVTVSADVAITTHLAGWMNRKGIYFPAARTDPFADVPQALRWREGPDGQHIELGIAEHDLFLTLAAFGLTAELSGTTLLPIGTLYDPFVSRGLDALYHALYGGARFVVVATPSGISLAPEGGAHQSVITPGIGVTLPDLAYYEPAFAREVEWILLAGLRAVAERRESLYLRLTTAPVDQRLALPPSEALREAVLAGGYRLIDARREGWSADGAVNIFAVGVSVPAAVEAARRLGERGAHASVFVVTSPDRLYRGLRSPRPYVETLVSADEEEVPIVSVLDGHSHALAFLGGALGVPQMALGVDSFGQSGTRPELYRHYGVDADAIVAAATTLLGGP